MKKLLALVLSLLMVCMVSFALAAEPTFEVGEDACEYAVEGASGWNTYTAYVKITAGEDVLFNGPVTMTSDTMTAGEFTLAAVYEAGCGAEGIEAGFVTSIGEYVSGSDAEGNYWYWNYTINGKHVPHTCSDMRVLAGDYLWWDFIIYDADAGIGANVDKLPLGFDIPFEVGEDETEYVVEGSSGWNVATVNVKIVANEEVLYNGVVTLTSDFLRANEVTLAAAYEAGCGFDGIEAGFVNSIGEYQNGTTVDGMTYYWTYTINGKTVPFASNEPCMLDGDYLLWEFVGYAN